MSLDEPWVWALAAVAGGLVVGAVLAGIARRTLGGSQRRPALKLIAGPTSTFLFWLAAATGVLFAIGQTSPETLRPIPRRIIDWLPNALVAGLLLLAGYAAGVAISLALGSTIERATGRRPRFVERIVRWAVMGAAVVLALGNLGVQTTALQIIVAGVVFGIALTMALVAGLGGREVASNIATGRSLRADVVPGARLITSELSGVITDLRPTLAIVETDDGRRMFVPYRLLLDQTFELNEPVTSPSA